MMFGNRSVSKGKISRQLKTISAVVAMIVMGARRWLDKHIARRAAPTAKTLT